MAINLYWSSCKAPLNYLDRYLEKKNPQISSFLKIRAVGAELRADRQTDGRTAMTKVIDVFRNSANAPVNLFCLHFRNSGVCFHYMLPTEMIASPYSCELTPLLDE